MTMSTQSTSPISDLMEGLGIDLNPSTPEMEGELNDTTEENLTLDSDTATSDDAELSDTLDATDTAEADTDTSSELEALRAELDKLNKRISDKDKYINELRNSKQQEVKEEVSEVEEESFFDDPEGKFKEVLQQLKIANLRIDEQTYAAGKKDYWDVVTPDSIRDGFAKDPTFMDEFNRSARPYETAYEYLSKQKQESVKSEQALRDKIRQEILNEMGVDKKKKEVPPNVNNVGKSASGVSEAAVDGFAQVFGNY